LLTAPLDPTTTFSGPGSGSRSRLPRMVVVSAKTIHQHMKWLKSLATSHGAQSLALVIGPSLRNALQSSRFQEASTVAEAQKPGFTSSLRTHSLEVKNAATQLETRKLWIVVIVVAKSLASASSAIGATAAPHVVVGPSREPSKSHKGQSVVVLTAHTTMATLRLSHVEWTHAPLIAMDHGAAGPNAVKHAPIVRPMVPLVRSRASSLSL